MKILVVCQYYYPEPFRISDICETLMKNGHNVTVLTGLPNYPEGIVLDDYRKGKKRKEVINGVHVIRSYEIGRANSKLGLLLNYFSFAVSASFKAMLIKDNYDIVLVYQLSPVLMAIPAIIYKKKHNKKMLLYCLDLWPASLAAGGIQEISIIYKLFLRISKWIYNSADSILVTSRMFKDYLYSTIGLNDKTTVRHLPQYAEDLFSQKINTSRKDTVDLVFAGNIGDMQSVETIIKAANEIKYHSNIKFHIVGDGSKLDSCKQLAENLDAKNVAFYGRCPVDEMPYYYSMADAMLITLKDDKVVSYTMPGKLQSYMASGKPIIGAINGEARLVIEEADCGLCCDAEDYKNFAQLTLNFCNNDKKDQMGLNAQRYYLENYSKEKFINMLEKAITNLGA